MLWRKRSCGICAHGAWGGRDVGGPGAFCGAGEGTGWGSESDKSVVEHVRAYFQAIFLQEPHLLLTFAVRGQKS